MRLDWYVTSTTWVKTDKDGSSQVLTFTDVIMANSKEEAIGIVVQELTKTHAKDLDGYGLRSSLCSVLDLPSLQLRLDDARHRGARS